MRTTVTVFAICLLVFVIYDRALVFFYNFKATIVHSNSLDQSLNNENTIFATTDFFRVAGSLYDMATNQYICFPTINNERCLNFSILVSYDEVPNFLMMNYPLDFILVMMKYPPKITYFKSERKLHVSSL